MTPLTAENLISALEKTVPIFSRRKVPFDLADTVARMFRDGNNRLDRERFNILMAAWHLPPANAAFYARYFGGGVGTVEELIGGLERFIRQSLWHFGDLERAYKFLSRHDDIDGFFAEHEFTQDFEARLPWTLIQDIPPADRGFLGYVSGERPYRQREILTVAEAVIKEIDTNQALYQGLPTADVVTRVLERLSRTHPTVAATIAKIDELQQGLDLFSLPSLKENQGVLATIRKEIEATIKRVEVLKETGKDNQLQYLRNIESIDVYVATSMRDDQQYIEMAEFVRQVFSDPEVAPLNLRFFDPTLCYCDSRLDKGIIECLLVRTAKVTIYCAQEEDTFGKDSELSATLCQGKPAIVYVPIGKQDRMIPKLVDGEIKQVSEAEVFNKRANTFKEFHPLGLQIGLDDGVARGVIVVRDAKQCATALRKILTNALEVTVTSEQHGIVLREKDTQSVLRVMTGWGELASAFWNNFFASQSPKLGQPK